jgi:hypothetical protein
MPTPVSGGGDMAYTIIYEKAGREIGREVIYVSLAAAQTFANDMVATGEYDLSRFATKQT